MTDVNGTQTLSAAQYELVDGGGHYRIVAPGDGTVRIENCVSRQPLVTVDALAKPGPRVTLNTFNAAHVDVGAARTAAAKAKKPTPDAVPLKKQRKVPAEKEEEAAPAPAEPASAKAKKPMTEAQRAAKAARAKERRALAKAAQAE